MRLKKQEVGGLNILLFPLILVTLLFVFSLVFGYWAYAGKQDYKNNVDKKITTAENIAVEQNSSKKDNEFLEKEKVPTRTYKGSELLGSITFNYPKTWSGYEQQTEKELKLMMQPGVVSSNTKTAYSLRVEVLDTAYTNALSNLESSVKSGKLKASAFRLAKVPGVLGTRFDGEFESSNGATKGTLVVLPNREKSIKISTESLEGVGDFNNIILPSFTFSP